MALEFAGPAARLAPEDFQRAAATLQCDTAAVRAVCDVESSGGGFLPDGRPKILFEAHIFSARTGHIYDASHPNVSSRVRNKALYGPPGVHQYDRLSEAIALDREAALQSASWGMFQVMGFNFASCGFADVKSFVAAMMEGEGRQLAAFVGFCQGHHLDTRLVAKDWVGFAQGYNGPDYASNQYDTRLAAAYAQHSSEIKPTAAEALAFGWIRDMPSQNDVLYSPASEVVTSLPRSASLRDKFPEVYSQGNIRSCTANAIAAAIAYDRARNHETPAFVPSRLFIYYNERDIEGSVPRDAGAQIRNGVASVADLGVCSEDEWPYGTPNSINGLFPVGSPTVTKPPQSAYDSAQNFAADSFMTIQQDLVHVKACLAEGYPIVFGFMVYPSFYQDPLTRNVPLADVPLPHPGEQPIDGHSVLVVGYDDDAQRFLLRNSWSADVQDGGYFTMPYAYLLSPKLASDFWTIRSVKN